MGFFVCRCGEDIPLKEIPAHAEAAFYPHREEMAATESCAAELAAFTAAIAQGTRTAWISSHFSPACVSWADEELIYAVLRRQLGIKSRSMLECPVCGRIYLENPRHQGKFAAFRPEPVSSPETHHVEQPGSAGFVTPPENIPTSEAQQLHDEYGCFINSAPRLTE